MTGSSGWRWERCRPALPVAFVIPRPGEAPDPEELRDFCRGSIAGFKIPRRFFPASEFPMTASGQVQRFRLRAEAAERMREGKPRPPGETTEGSDASGNGRSQSGR